MLSLLHLESFHLVTTLPLACFALTCWMGWWSHDFHIVQRSGSTRGICSPDIRYGESQFEGFVKKCSPNYANVAWCWLLVLWLCSNMKHSCTQYTIDSWKCDHFEPFAYPHVRRHINNALIHAIQLPNPILVDLYPTVIISNITINCAFIYTVHDSGEQSKICIWLSGCGNRNPESSPDRLPQGV